MPRDPPPTKPTIYRITSTTTLTNPSTLTVGRQQLLVGQNHMISQPPSPYNEDATPYTHSQTTVQAPSSAVDDHRSSEEQRRGHVSRKQSRRSTAASDSPPMPIDPPQFNLDESQKAQGRSPAHDPRDVPIPASSWKTLREEIFVTRARVSYLLMKPNMMNELIVGVDPRHGVDDNQSHDPPSAPPHSLDRTPVMTTF